MIFSIIFSLSITLCVETIIYMFLKPRDLKLFLIVSLLNVILNPLMNVVLLYLVKDDTTYWIVLLLYEVMTTVVESLVIHLMMKFKYFKVLLVAIAANAASFLIGLALMPLHNYTISLIILTCVFFLGYVVVYLMTLLSFIKRTKQDN